MISRPKSVASVCRQQVEQHVAREHVDAHRRHERLLRRVAGERPTPSGCSGRSPPSRSRFGFSSNATIWPSRSKRKMPICVASSGVTGCAAIVMSARRSMCASTSSRVVHPVEVIAGENQVVVGVVAHEVTRGLAARRRRCPGTSSCCPASVRPRGSRRSPGRTDPSGRSGRCGG